jgi:phenylpropionate dioxygenase-like ring-hydroxylating dioxygenase large terminal subunit
MTGMRQGERSVLERLDEKWKSGTPAIAEELFTDPELYEIEMSAIFGGPVWHMIGHASEFRREGDFKTHRIGKVPVILTRVGDSYRVLVNSCAHRGAEVVRRPRGNAADPGAFTCIYHRWRYNAEGRVIGVGRKQGYGEALKQEDYCLPSGRIAVVAGLIFASLHPAPPPIEEYLGPTITGYLKKLFGPSGLKYLGVQRAEFQCNWKVYVENIYDSYHAVTLHKAFTLMRIRKPSSQLADDGIAKYGHYMSEFEADFPEDSGLANSDLLQTKARAENDFGHTICNIFPASQMSGQLDVLAIRAVVPCGPTATEVHFHCFGREGDAQDVELHRLWQSANVFGPQGLINLEDASALARVQDSMMGRSRGLQALGGERFPGRRSDEKALDTFYGAYRRLVYGQAGGAR